MDMRREAIISTMRGINGALESAATMAHAKAVIAGVQNEVNANIEIAGVTIDLVYGYPAGTVTGIVPILNTPAGDWKQRASVFPGAWVYWHDVIDEDAGSAQCYIRYRQPTSAGARPVIDFQDSGC
jgi:MSHA pilin protein MshA